MATNAGILDMNWDQVMDRYLEVRRRWPAPLSDEDQLFCMELLELIVPMVTDDEWDFARDHED